ncbi:MAG: DNA-directed RNA polymerase subunit beta, partial [Pontimonas sp.]
MSTSRMEAAITDPADLVKDPADLSAIAHATASVLLSTARSAEDALVRDSLVRFADEHGLDTLAELWSQAHPLSLPGALWRLYLVRAVIQHNPGDAAELFQRGVEGLPTIDPIVAGAPDPLNAADFSRVLDDILRGAFEGDLAHA